MTSAAIDAHPAIDWPARIWVIGSGNMGGAILQAWLAAGAPADRITIIDPAPAQLPAGMSAQAQFPAEPQLGAAPDLILLATKPQILPQVAPALAPHLAANSKLISVLAGVETATLKLLFPKVGSIIRLIPNMAVTVGKSPMLLYSEDAALRPAVTALFSSLGPPEWLDDENLLHIATALSGSGPAFVFRFIDALAHGGEQLGLEPAQAKRLAIAMVEGAGLLAAVSAEDPATLANRVASPGGTTRKGLDVLDADGRINALMFEVLDAATKRSREMAQEAKG